MENPESKILGNIAPISIFTKPAIMLNTKQRNGLIILAFMSTMTDKYHARKNNNHHKLGYNK